MTNTDFHQEKWFKKLQDSFNHNIVIEKESIIKINHHQILLVKQWLQLLEKIVLTLVNKEQILGG